MIVMGIETSCDDTGVAILKDKKDVMANFVSSQEKFHSIFGGVVPEIAARKHLDNLLPLVHRAFETSGLNFEDIDCIGATNRPGLVPSLVVGFSFAKALAFASGKPLVAVNHLEAHTFAIFLEEEVSFPFISLVVSGGHTSLFLVKDFGVMEYIGRTLDDAAGEAFDKVAKFLGLGYPGGPVIDAMSKEAEPKIAFPIANVDGYNFSFSGLKTAVIMYVKKNNIKSDDRHSVAEVVASFQEAVVDALMIKTFKAASEYNIDTIVVSGGVACNSRLREKFTSEAQRKGMRCLFPSPKLCTDNGLMVAYVASYRFERGMVSDITEDVYSRYGG